MSKWMLLFPVADAYPYGPDKGDTSLPIQNDATVEVPIDTGVYIGTSLQYSAYVSVGCISLNSMGAGL